MPNFQKLDINLQKKLKENIRLAPYTTYKIGGPAKYFFECKTIDELKNILEFCHRKKLPYFILGGGSNVLISDKGFSGMVIKLNFSQINFENKNHILFAEAGILLSQLILEAKKQNLKGLEYLWGIPGTLGGAIFGNVGAKYPFGGAEIKDFIEWVKILDENLKIKKLKKHQCKFAYRHSIFKEKPWIILEAALKLKPGKKNEIEDTIKKITLHRRKNPQQRCAGCVFKNIEMEKLNNSQMKNLNKILPKKFFEFKKIPAGWLIEQCNLKGKKIGQAMISKRHANFIINLGKAKANDVLKLMKLAKKQVYEKFKIELEEENILVGF